MPRPPAEPAGGATRIVGHQDSGRHGGRGDLGRALTRAGPSGFVRPWPAQRGRPRLSPSSAGAPRKVDALLHKAWTAVDPSSDAGTAGGICQRQVLHALARFHGRDLVTWAERARLVAPPGSPPAVEAQAIEGLGAMGRYDGGGTQLPERERCAPAGRPAHAPGHGKGLAAPRHGRRRIRQGQPCRSRSHRVRPRIAAYLAVGTGLAGQG